jgi:hypothetical protein
MPFQRTIANIPQEQRSRTLLAGTTTAGLLGRNQSPTAIIDSGTQRAFNAIPRAMNSPAGSRTQRTLGFEPEQYGPPAPSSAVVPKTPVAQPAPSSMIVPKTPAPSSAVVSKTPVTPSSMIVPKTLATMPKQEESEEDGVKQYKADEIVFKADKFDFGNNQDSSTSSPTPAASPAPAAPPAPSSTGGSGSSSSAAGATGTSTSTATPMQSTIVTGPRMARASAANEAAGRTIPPPPQAPAAAGQNTRAPGTQQRSDVIPQIDPNNPGSLEPADAGSRYARLFGMGMVAYG